MSKFDSNIHFLYDLYVYSLIYIGNWYTTQKFVYKQTYNCHKI